MRTTQKHTRRWSKTKVRVVSPLLTGKYAALGRITKRHHRLRFSFSFATPGVTIVVESTAIMNILVSRHDLVCAASGPLSRLSLDLTPCPPHPPHPPAFHNGLRVQR